MARAATAAAVEMNHAQWITIVIAAGKMAQELRG